MENKQKGKNLNVYIWGGEKEFNVEGADAVVCIAIKHNDENCETDTHIEGGFTGGDYMRIFGQLAETFGREHLMMFMMMDSVKELSRRIMGGKDEENKPEADDCNGEGTDRH